MGLSRTKDKSIIPQTENNPLEGHPVASGDDLEHERTPEVAAVMRIDGGGLAGSYQSGGVLAGDQIPAGIPLNKLNSSVMANSASSLPLPSSPAPAGAYLDIRTCNREVLKGSRIMGFNKLRNMLQPEHKYFEAYWGEIKGYLRYFDSKTGSDLLYPQIKTVGRTKNPYKKYKLNRQCAGRAAKRMLAVVDSRKLQNFRIVDLETTMPKAVSEYLAGLGKTGRDKAWALEGKFYQALIDDALIPEGLARRVNLHTWSTENPLQPHFHHHTLIGNHYRVGIEKIVPRLKCWVCGELLLDNMTIARHIISEHHASFELKWAEEYVTRWKKGYKAKQERSMLRKWTWKRLRSGGLVPWNESQLIKLKANWLNTVINYVRQHNIGGAWENQAKLLTFQRRHGVKGLCRLISFMGRFNAGLIDVYVSYASLDTSIGKAKFVNKLAYNGRNPIEDYAVFSNKNPDCDMPPDFIEGYPNKARLFGWWRDLDKELGPVSPEITKLSPYDGEPMDYLGKYDITELVDDISGPLIAVDIIRGRPVERYLTDDDVGWLKRVDLYSWLNSS